MKRQFILLSLILILLITSCGPSVEEAASQTATASTAIAASWTKTPTPTLTHTPTFAPTITPTSTLTPTITPTPLGGGPGQIACLNCINGIFPSISLVKPDGALTTLLTDKYSAGASFDWSRNGARLGYFTITGITGSEGQKKYLTCVVDANGYNEQCFEIGGGSFSLSPDGSKMAIGEHALNLYLVDFDSGRSEILMETEAMQWKGWDVDWSPDGTKLVVAGDEIGIAVTNIMNKEKFPIVEADKPYYYNTPRWSPDGKKIIFAKRNDLFIVNADGSDALMLVRNAFDPRWSPDGTHIAYITGNSDQQNIIMMTVDGTNKVRLTPSQSLYQWSWSPDGKFIIYRAIVAGSVYSTFYTDLFKVEVTNQKVSSLAKNVVRYTVSPDGSAIAFTVEPRGEEKCNKSYVINLDGVILSEWKDIACGGVVGPWRPTTSSDEEISLPPPATGQSWEFETAGDTEGWVGINDLDPLQVSNGYLLTKSTGGDPYMYSPSIFLFDAVANSKIEISMKVSSGSLGQLFFITDTDIIYDESKSLRFNVKGDGQFHTYMLDMSRGNGWDGLIRQIRLDPTNTRATIEVDYVRISKP